MVKMIMIRQEENFTYYREQTKDSIGRNGHEGTLQIGRIKTNNWELVKKVENGKDGKDFYGIEMSNKVVKKHREITVYIPHEFDTHSVTLAWVQQITASTLCITILAPISSNQWTTKDLLR